MSSKRKFIIRAIKNKSSTSQGQNPVPMEDQDLATAYESLLAESAVLGENSGDALQAAKNIDDIVERANALVTNIKASSSELLLVDAELMANATEQMRVAVDKMDIGESDFNLDEWAEAFRVKAVPKGEESPFRALAKAAEPFIRKTVPTGWSPLNGGFELASDELPTKKKRQPAERKKKDEAEKTEPEKAVEVDNADNAPEKAVKEVYMLLKKYYKANNRQPLNFFKFVIDPTSFSKSALNIFHTSFLLNDGHAKWEWINGHPTIAPVSFKQKENAAPEPRSMFILSLDWTDWENLIKKLNITEAMIPSEHVI